jgi:general stress protein 26
MRKAITLSIFLLLFGLAANAAELKGTVLKVKPSENQIVLKTERGEETLFTTKETKGVENVKEGAKVIVTFSEKDGQPKISEITPDR